MADKLMSCPFFEMHEFFVRQVFGLNDYITTLARAFVLESSNFNHLMTIYVC